MKAPRPTFRLAALALALWATTAHATDPFYVELLEAGTRDYLRSEYPAAAGKLRIACFGLLEEPPLLAEGLMRLALAQAGAGDDSGFRATFDRIVALEAAFAAYSRLPPGTPFKLEFERALPQRLNAGDLASVPAFAAVIARMREAKLAALPPKRLRRELERRLQVNPEDSEALVLLTRLEISQNQPQKAEKRLADLLAANPENRIARCVRGQMRLRGDDCSRSMEDLSFCSGPPIDPVLGARYLRCLVQGEDWGAAGKHLASLPLEVRALEEVASLVLAIPPSTLEILARAPSGAARSERTEPAQRAERRPEPVGTTQPPQTAQPERLEAEDRDRAIRLLRRATTSSSRAELSALFAEAADIARRYAGDRELQFIAAEIAYRHADWPQAVEFFRRAGLPDLDRPLLRFYLAIALYETGETAEAASILESALPRLESTPFVERYRALILGPSSP